MTVKFSEEAEAPARVRANEFREFVAAMAAKPGKVFSYVVPKAETPEETVKAFEADKRKMAEAGNELATPVTIRTDNLEAQKDGSLKAYLHATKKVVRARKEK